MTYNKFTLQELFNSVMYKASFPHILKVHQNLFENFMLVVEEAKIIAGLSYLPIFENSTILMSNKCLDQGPS